MRVSSLNDELCYQFYYWLGGMVSRSPNGSNSFYDVMKSIYLDLKKNLASKGVCTNVYQNITKDEFDQRKLMYDYTQDYLSILAYTPTGKETCVQEYYDHLAQLKGACAPINTYCQSGSSNASGQYCTWFKEKGQQYCATEKLEKLSCKKVGGSTSNQNTGSPRPGSTGTCSPGPCPNPNQAGSSGSFSDADLVDGVSGGEGKGGSDGGDSHRKEGEDELGGSAVIPAAVSGGLAAIGLPALAYFFYKYKSHLFFLKGNNSSAGGMSGSRRKRSLRRGFNDFEGDEDDDYTSTTEDSSEYSVPYTSSSSR
ncbi:KIR protein [Plasmodium coatneyi]|uniref:KIR protein n=1 Tax=Plasmodium coatneyi TaxID=208452 RepID=A0A1B1DYP0_9APIC|nr:KIR protein [Plasmodium coatneyi]ANQ07922.1 KIR protein [Plasmodium coatneyi]